MSNILKYTITIAALLILLGGIATFAVSVETRTPFYKVLALFFQEVFKNKALPDRSPKTCREEPCPRPVKIPESVSNRYAQLKNEPFRSMSWCKKGNTEVYLVGGGGGFTGTTLYFDSEGNQIATESFTDIVTPDTSSSPVDLYGYTCTLLSESMPSMPLNT